MYDAAGAAAGAIGNPDGRENAVPALLYHAVATGAVEDDVMVGVSTPLYDAAGAAAGAIGNADGRAPPCSDRPDSNVCNDNEDEGLSWPDGLERGDGALALIEEGGLPVCHCVCFQLDGFLSVLIEMSCGDPITTGLLGLGAYVSCIGSFDTLI